ncbi:2-dehydro-3-deoxygalactonokinase [Jiulongibacter sediminis]|uniref:2-dehydro-3-deoxygalactonokinase n=1 Tax=Jiulongibacter sediminis TaxID=1605367 RepID=UPI0006DBE663|nr:2-dehydro-3-deoxygalactonokinase [Jiulongibacter sediminis]
MSHFISCDWGTSNFRLRVVETKTGEVLETFEENIGIRETYDEWQRRAMKIDRKPFYLNILSDKISKLNSSFPENAPVLISGMASSSIGYKELPYGQTPFDLRRPQLIFEKDLLPGTSREVWLFSGLQTENDIMRGEETLILGAYALDSSDKTLVLPGTHSKHVTIKNGKVRNFKTYMTGEFFELLSSKSVLQNTVENSSNSETEAFKEGVLKGAQENLLNSAFHARTASVLHGKPTKDNFEYLSGLLIGSELKELQQSTDEVLFISGSALKQAYFSAAKLLLKTNQFGFLSAEDALIKGHLGLFSEVC